jgi:radical SAM/Cys-rich protein
MTAVTSLPVLHVNSFRQKCVPTLSAAGKIRTLQINLGLVCNLACHHCHVGSSPKRDGPQENMSAVTARRVMDWIARNPQIERVDLTGGSPEMNPNFRPLVRQVRNLGRQVTDRCNPTIIPYTDHRNREPYAWIPQFLAEHKVEVVASLPCYLEENVDHQRGHGAYHASIEGLRRLNDAGYGRDPGLQLNLVYNPNGPHLPPPQESLATDYHRELKERVGLVFNDLWTITNMPIKRWRHELERSGKLADYMKMLAKAYNPLTIDGLMCRHQIHIDSAGRIYDCDFNYALDLRTPGPPDRFLWDTTADELAGRPIATDDHCYGCTAGAGSSCGGTLT